MALKVLAFDGTVGHFLFEHPKGKVSEVLLTHFYYIYSVKRICEVFLGGLIFLN